MHSRRQHAGFSLIELLVVMAILTVLLALLLPAGLLAGAWGSQLIGGLVPCEMCHWQRWPHYAAVVIAALAFVDATVRLVDGVLDAESRDAESFTDGLLDYPSYTRPAVFRGVSVPDVLLSGDHAAIARWRREESVAEPPDTAGTVVPGPWQDTAGVDGDAIRSALAELPARMRAAVVLRHWMDLSVDETAELLGCSDGTVKSQTAKGIARLRALLDGPGVVGTGLTAEGSY